MQAGLQSGLPARLQCGLWCALWCALCCGLPISGQYRIGLAGRQPATGRLGRHQQPHRHERQPEARLQQRPRIDQRDHHRCAQQHQRPGPALAPGAQQAGSQQHDHGALCRHAPTGQHRVAGGRSQAQPAAGSRRRQPVHGAPAAPPQSADAQAGQPREHRDVNAADGHEMGNAGLPEHLPIGALDGALVTHRKCCQHTGAARVWHLTVDGVAHGLAQAVHRVASTIGQPLRVGAGRCGARHPHITGGTQALLKPQQLHVEPRRIERAVWQLQPQRQAPALAGAQAAAGVVQQGFIVEVVVPAQRQQRRQRHRPALRVSQRHRVLHLKAETQAGRPDLWQ